VKRISKHDTGLYLYLYHPDAGGSRHLCNVCEFTLHYMAQYTRRKYQQQLLCCLSKSNILFFSTVYTRSRLGETVWNKRTDRLLLKLRPRNNGGSDRCPNACNLQGLMTTVHLHLWIKQANLITVLCSYQIIIT
jgi:hypothetical protein